MSRIALRHFFTLLFVLWIASSLPAQELTDPLELARQLAATANDNATSLAERQDSVSKLEEAARLFVTVGEKLEAARTFNRAGRLQLILNSPENAITNHNQALNL